MPPRKKDFPPLKPGLPAGPDGPAGGTAPFEFSPEQARIRQAADECQVLFVAGEAGTGKTFLAAALALRELYARRAGKIFACRPAVEAAGERLGYLPGDGGAKVYPYMLPLYDAFKELGAKPDDLIREDKLEIAPLAYLRGRTMRGVSILDEAQNCTAGQLKLFLTRMGRGSKMIVVGDPDQNDLGHSSAENPFARLVKKVMNLRGKPPAHRVQAFILGRSAQRRDPIVNDFLELTSDL